MLNSHNPIGFTVSDAIKIQLAEILHQHEVYLIEDDVYEELYYGQKKPLALKSLDEKNLVLHCSSFSKTLGAGFRVGWVYAGKFSEHIQHLQLMSTLSVNPLIQSTLVEYLSHRHYEKHLKSVRKALKRLKKQYYDYLNERLVQHCQVMNYPSGYFLWIELPAHLDSNLLYQKLLNHKISVAPGSLFNATQQNKNAIRINCSFEFTTGITQALDILIAHIQE